MHNVNQTVDRAAKVGAIDFTIFRSNQGCLVLIWVDELGEELHDLLVLGALLGQELSLLLEHVQRLHCKANLLSSCLLDLVVKRAIVRHAEGILLVFIIAKSGRQRVVADDADWREQDLQAAAPDVWVVKEDVAFDFVFAAEHEAAVDLGKAPDALAAVQRASSLHLHVAGFAELVKELEDVLVLGRCVVAAADAKDLAVCVAYQRVVAGQYVVKFVDDQSLFLDLPVKTGSVQHLGGGQVVCDGGAKAMPRGLIGVSHRFNFVSHDILSFFFLFMPARLLCMG